MSPQKRRPQARKGRTAAAAKKSQRGPDRMLTFVGIAVLIVGVLLVIVLKPAKSAGLQLGDHWHAALGVYACDHWDGGANWLTPVDATSGGPVVAGTNTYSALHSHKDGLIHMEPAVTADTGSAASLGTYFKNMGFELSSTNVKFVTANLKNGDKCGTAPGKLHWLVNGKEQTGDPNSYVLHDRDWIVIAFLPDSKKITSLGKPPSYKNLAGAEGRTNSTSPVPSGSTPTSAATPTSKPAATPST
jgi:hypothetical protein